MHHPRPALDEAFRVQIAAQLSKQRDELDRIRRAVASGGPVEKSSGTRARLGLGDFLEALADP
jgi:hypothetical protein